MLKMQAGLQTRQYQSMDKELLRKDPTVRPLDAGGGEEMKTQLARAPWPQVKRPAEKKAPNDKRIDAKFKEWVAKNNIDPREYPVLKGVKS